jgi:hypothetical protein
LLRIFFITIFIILVSVINAQIYERYREDPVEVTYPKMLSVVWANDVFFQTDRYFTNGLELEYHTQWPEQLAIANLLIDPMSESGPVYSLILTHDIFTPKNVIGDPAQTDRPYAGVLMAGLKAAHFSAEKKYRFTSEISAGLIGEYAGGQFVQNGIHVMLPASEPIPGWTFQIRHTPTAQYSVTYEKGILSSEWINLDALGNARLGLPYTDFKGAGRVRIGKGPDYFSPDHLLSKSHDFYYFFIEGGVRTVMYDATLQGGIFNDENPHTMVNINPLVGEWKVGAAARYDNLQAEVGAQMYTAKFNGSLPHKWVFFKFGILF